MRFESVLGRQHFRTDFADIRSFADYFAVQCDAMVFQHVRMIEGHRALIAFERFLQVVHFDAMLQPLAPGANEVGALCARFWLAPWFNGFQRFNFGIPGIFTRFFYGFSFCCSGLVFVFEITTEG